MTVLYYRPRDQSRYARVDGFTAAEAGAVVLALPVTSDVVWDGSDDPPTPIRPMRIAGTPYKFTYCLACRARVQVHSKPGTTECAGCGAWVDNWTGRLATDRLLKELGH